MVYDQVIHGRFVDMRSITLDDAEFSYQIRLRPEVCNVVGQPASTIEEQKAFIKKQMQTKGDYYFVVCNKKGERIGLIGVYNIVNDMGELGREVNIGTTFESMEAEVLLQDFCSDVLHLKKTCAVVYKENKKVISMNKKLGRMPKKEVIRSGRESLYYEEEISEDMMSKIRELLNKVRAYENE